MASKLHFQNLVLCHFRTENLGYRKTGGSFSELATNIYKNPGYIYIYIFFFSQKQLRCS